MPASMMPQARLHPSAPMIMVLTSARPAVSTLRVPVLVRTMMSPNKTSEIRSTGSSNRLAGFFARFRLSAMACKGYPPAFRLDAADHVPCRGLRTIGSMDKYQPCLGRHGGAMPLLDFPVVLDLAGPHGNKTRQLGSLALGRSGVQAGAGPARQRLDAARHH